MTNSSCFSYLTDLGNSFQYRYYKAKLFITRSIRYLRWGRVSMRICATSLDNICEIEYRDSKGNRIGYWSHQAFDPKLPYRGQIVFWQKVNTTYCGFSSGEKDND